MKNVGVKILGILIILAISLMSFVGIYKKENGRRTSIIPEYKLGMDLSGAREVVLKVSDETKEVVYDAEGNVTEEGLDEEGNLKEGYKKENVKINKDEIRTEENFKMAKTIIEKRLEALGVDEYKLRQNTENGEIIIELPENDHTDEIISNLTYKGKFEIVDSETEEVLLNNNMVKESKAVYNTTEVGTTVSLNIEFNKEGKKKFEDITKTYVSTTNENGETTQKQVTIKLDDEQLLETSFDGAITSGYLQLSIGNVTTDTETISNYIEQASQVASLITDEKMELKYELDGSTYLASSITSRELQITICVVTAVAVIALMVLIVKFKVNGILAGLSYVGTFALLLLVLRYTNVVISLEGLVSLIVILVADYMFIYHMLIKLIKEKELNKNQIIKNVFMDYFWILFPALILSIVFTFMKWLVIASTGMIVFWSLIIMFVCNYVTSKALLEK